MLTRDWASELTVCPFCACGCGLYLQSTDGELRGVMPSEHHHVSGGRLCARGWAAHEASLWGRRLTEPLVRNGGAPAFATWPQALAVAVERLQAVLASGRPIGVLGSGRATNEENFLAVGLARAALRTGHVDSCLRAPYEDLLAGIAPADPGRDPGSALTEIEECDVILLLEGDLALTHPRTAFAIMKAVQRGARLVTAGPMRTRLSRLAWLHLPLVPGDEPGFAAALALATGGLGSGRPAHEGEAPTGAPAASGTPGTRPDPLRRTVEAYGGAARAAIIVAPTGAAPAGLHTVCGALAELARVTGHLRRPGSVILPLPVRSNTRGALEMGAMPDQLPGPCPLDDESARRRLARAWGQVPAASRGHGVERMIHEVAALIVVADDPPVALPSEASARRALAGLECLIVLDAFVTPTVEAAHVALPIASPAETEGTFTNMEGRIQWLRAGAPPPGAARHGWQVLAELGTALGLAGRYASVDSVLGEIRAAVPAYGEAPAREPPGGHAWALQAFPPVPASREARRPEAFTGREDRADAGGEPADVAAVPFQLVRTGVFEWGDDPLVVSSPTLRREHASLRKRFPRGLIEMNGGDAQRLGIRDGWQVRLASPAGEVLVPVSLREDVEPGTLLVPFAFRDRLEPVLGPEPRVAVRVERV
jgi:predicted molibdopterin-dependent oxidoreductase YjgC